MSSILVKNLNNLKDEDLLELLPDGNNEAFDELVKRNAPKYYALAYRMVFNQSDAEDIVQDAFLKLWKNPHLWQKGRNAKFSTWFYRVVSNMCIDFQRKKKPLQLDDDVDFEDHRPNPEEVYDAKQKQTMLKKCILGLPERQRQALNLCYYQGLSNKEAAEVLEVNIKALESLLGRARGSLKDRLREMKLMENHK